MNADYKNLIKNDKYLNQLNKGYNLLNLDYNYLIQNIFGDESKLKYWFDISIIASEEEIENGSIKNILENVENNDTEKKYEEKEYSGFIIIDEDK